MFLLGETITTPPEPSVAEQALASPQKKSKKKKKGKKRATDNAVGGEFFKESTSQQPSLLQIMEVVGGVLLKEGDGSKQGPQMLEDPKKMSRTTYKMHQTMVEQPATAEQTTVQPSQGSPGPLQTQAGDQNDISPDILAMLSGVEDEVGPPSPVALAARLPQSNMQDEDDENIKLIKANDWGANTKGKDPVPAPLPHKPNTREKRDTLGHQVLQGKRRAPRDRPFITTEPLKRLPPPLFPQTQGHGFSQSKIKMVGGFGEGSSIAEGTADANANGLLSPLGQKSVGYTRDWGKDEPGSIHVSPSAGHYVKQLTQ